MTDSMTDSTILFVPVPEIEERIDPFRRRLDRTRRQDMPAHVTVLVPFAPGHQVDGMTRDRLATIFEQFERFEFVLSRCNWFERRVLYLEPDPPEPFRAMTRAVTEAFPAYRPYEGAFDEIVPHVTVGEGGRFRKRRFGLRRAARRLQAMTPVHAAADEVWLMRFDPASARWCRVETFRLAAPGTARGAVTLQGSSSAPASTPAPTA